MEGKDDPSPVHGLAFVVDQDCPLPIPPSRVGWLRTHPQLYETRPVSSKQIIDDDHETLLLPSLVHDLPARASVCPLAEEVRVTIHPWSSRKRTLKYTSVWSEASSFVVVLARTDRKSFEMVEMAVSSVSKPNVRKDIPLYFSARACRSKANLRSNGVDDRKVVPITLQRMCPGR